MIKFNALFKIKAIRIIGMVHVDALPGTPKYGGSIEKIIHKACEEAELYKNCHVDSIIIENMHDVPYIQPKYFEPEVTASMAKICCEVKRTISNHMPCGIQILAGGNKEALAIAKVCNLQFIRAEGFVFSHIGDEGFMDANAGHLLRYRKHIDAENILIFTDIKKKHCSHAITNDLRISEIAKAAEFFLSDGLVLTGTTTGDPADIRDCHSVKEITNLPILIGSGVTADNLHNYVKADALIIGSYFKKEERWENDLSKDNVLRLMEKVYKLRGH